MADFLVFQLYGPLASWGDIAVGEYRPSFVHPSKSAIVGLLAAALGIRRDEEEKQKALADACQYAVRIDAMGTLLRDYHTAQVPPSKKGKIRYTRKAELANENLNTILSTRDYRCDAAYTVAICLRDDYRYTVQMLAEALRKPVFTLYLGRKSCPLALPLCPVVVTVENFREAFENMPCASLDLPGIPEETTGVYWEDGVDSGYGKDHIITRRDMLLSRKRWQFAERRECYSGNQREE